MGGAVYGVKGRHHCKTVERKRCENKVRDLVFAVFVATPVSGMGEHPMGTRSYLEVRDWGCCLAWSVESLWGGRGGTFCRVCVCT